MLTYYVLFVLLVGLACVGALALVAAILYGVSPDLFRAERESLGQVRDRAVSHVRAALDLSDKEAELCKGFLLGVVFGAALVAKYLGVL